MAIFRCTPDASKRWIFNIFHFCVGFLAQLASATAIFLGIWQFGLPDWCMIIMAALVAFHVIIEIILIIHKNAKVLCKCCFKKKRSGREDIAMDRFDEPQKPKSSESNSGDIFKTVILFVHVIGVVAFSIVLMVQIGQHDGPMRESDDILSKLD